MEQTAMPFWAQTLHPGAYTCVSFAELPCLHSVLWCHSEAHWQLRKLGTGCWAGLYEQGCLRV